MLSQYSKTDIIKYLMINLMSQNILKVNEEELESMFFKLIKLKPTDTYENYTIFKGRICKETIYLSIKTKDKFFKRDMLQERLRKWIRFMRRTTNKLLVPLAFVKFIVLGIVSNSYQNNRSNKRFKISSRSHLWIFP